LAVASLDLSLLQPARMSETAKMKTIALFIPFSTLTPPSVIHSMLLPGMKTYTEFNPPQTDRFLAEVSH